MVDGSENEQSKKEVADVSKAKITRQTKGAINENQLHAHKLSLQGKGTSLSNMKLFDASAYNVLANIGTLIRLKPHLGLQR
jgi:hypothetical protein